MIVALHRATHATLHALGTRLAGLDLSAPDINVLANLADGARRTVGAATSCAIWTRATGARSSSR